MAISERLIPEVGMATSGLFSGAIWLAVKRQLQSLANRRSIYPSSPEGCANTCQPSQNLLAHGIDVTYIRYINDKAFRNRTTRHQGFSLFCPFCDQTAFHL